MVGIIESMSNVAINLIESLGYWGVFIGMTLESACIPLPSEVIMPFAGFVVNEGRLTLWGITLVGALGNLFGSLIAYYVGLKGGKPFLEKYGKYFLISQNSIDMAHDWFERYGHEAVFVARLLPGIRTFISLPAGIAEMDLKKFVIYSFAGSLPWCLLLGYTGVILGSNWESIKPYFHILDAIIITGIIGVLIYLFYKYRKNKSLNLNN